MRHRKTFLAVAVAGLLGIMGWQAPSSAAVAPMAAQAGKAPAVDNSILQIQRGRGRGIGRGIGRGGRGIGRGFGGMRRGGIRRGVRRGGIGIGRGSVGRRYGSRRWRGGRWVAPLIGGAILGSYAYPRTYRYRRSGGSARQLCADRFKSFRWSDGTYQPYGGVPRRLCPYLR